MNGERSTEEEKPHFSCQDLLAFFMMALSLFFWFISYIYANEKDINFIDTTLMKGLGICSINFIICLVQGYEFDLKADFNISKIIIRNIIMVVDAIVFAIVQFYLPLPIVHGISATGIIFIFILDYLINNIRINKTQAIGISVGMIGIFFTIGGKFILQYLDPSFQTTTQFENYHSQSAFAIMLASIILLGVVGFWSYAILLIKDLKTLNTFQISFHFGVTFMLFAGLIYPLNDTSLPLEQYFTGFFTIGLPSALNLICTAISIKMTHNTGILSLALFFPIIFSYLFSIFRYNQTQNYICNFGIMLAVLGTSLVLLYNHKQK